MVEEIEYGPWLTWKMAIKMMELVVEMSMCFVL